MYINPEKILFDIEQAALPNVKKQKRSQHDPEGGNIHAISTVEIQLLLNHTKEQFPLPKEKGKYLYQRANSHFSVDYCLPLQPK